MKRRGVGGTLSKLAAQPEPIGGPVTCRKPAGGVGSFHHRNAKLHERIPNRTSLQLTNAHEFTFAPDGTFFAET
jgi:hypothetical protein